MDKLSTKVGGRIRSLFGRAALHEPFYLSQEAIHDLERRWTFFNKKVFEGKLTKPVIEIMDPTTEYECVEELGLFGTYQFKEDSHYIGITPFLFQSLTGNDSPEFEAIKFKFAEDVLLHEMVHQFIIENDDWDANEE